jgi:phosphatidylserine decarboxylase
LQAHSLSKTSITVFTRDEMTVLVLQILILCVLITAILLCAIYFPYPSPLIRRWLPPRKRWPEMQIREWLKRGKFQRAFLRHFYNDPERWAPPGNAMLAPADGLVTSTDERDGVRYLVIALSFWDMHVQRSPMAGTVLDVQSSGDAFMDGEGRQFAFLREKTCPVQKRVVLATDGAQVAVRLITSVAARRIETWVQAGERIERGQRLGRILLGSTVVLELPATTKLLVRTGDRVWAGQTAVAEGLSAP